MGNVVLSVTWAFGPPIEMKDDMKGRHSGCPSVSRRSTGNDLALCFCGNEKNQSEMLRCAQHDMTPLGPTRLACNVSFCANRALGHEDLLRVHHGERVSHFVHGRHQQPRTKGVRTSTQTDPWVHLPIQHQSIGSLRGLWRHSCRDRAGKANYGLAADEEGRIDRIEAIATGRT